MIDLLRQLLVVREAVQKASDIAGEYGYLESLPELKQIDFAGARRVRESERLGQAIVARRKSAASPKASGA